MKVYHGALILSLKLDALNCIRSQTLKRINGLSCGLNAGELFDNRFMRVHKEATSISEPVLMLFCY